METPDTKTPPVTNTGGTSARLASLDVFRGITITGMLLVNNMALGGATPAQLTHAAWNGGIHFADLVFPWFLFIVGAAIPYSAASFKRHGGSSWGYYGKALNRAVILVLLGCLVDSSIARTPEFALGVLQIIGLAYLAGALTAYRSAWARAAAAAILLAAHWAALRFVPAPGIPAGTFQPDANIVSYLNRTYLQPLHLAGIISVIPTSALVVTGSLAGSLLKDARLAAVRKAMYLILCGIGLAGLGWLWNLDLPFNKPVWTAPYILCTAGLGMAALGTLFWIIDVKHVKSWAFPATVFGTNAIAAYVMPILVKVYILQGWQCKLPGASAASLQGAALTWCTELAGRITGGWMYTFCYILFWWLVFLWMYKKKVFLKI